MERILTPKTGIQTEILQKAIDDCFLSGGGRVVLTAGTYLTGGIRLRSNVTLYLCTGAVLLGTRDPDDYFAAENDTLEPMPEEYRSEALWESPRKRKNADHITKAGSRWNHALIRILDAHDVSVIGESGSYIDGADCYDEIGEEHYRGPHGIAFHFSERLHFAGYTIRNTGNWAHLGYGSKNVDFSNITVLGGHDGVHISSCDAVSVTCCEFYTGDDCVAGFDNKDVYVADCILNSACSAFRFGGRDVLIERCRFYGPARYFFRGSLSKEDKISGNPAPTDGRKTMLSFFTYYSDFTLKVRHDPGNIVVRNCTGEQMERFLLYDFSGAQIWQMNRPLSSISFENVTAKDIRMPIDAYGDAEHPITLSLTNCCIAFSEPVSAAIRAANYSSMELENVAFHGVDGPLVLSFGGDGEIDLQNVGGVTGTCRASTEPYRSKSI
ncbi:MAG: hypothetical protein J6B77_08570 [Clostridia bacterium]|nr:hypothetical protein [Clostridia bacterium]